MPHLLPRSLVFGYPARRLNVAQPALSLPKVPVRARRIHQRSAASQNASSQLSCFQLNKNFFQKTAQKRLVKGVSNRIMAQRLTTVRTRLIAKGMRDDVRRKSSVENLQSYLPNALHLF